MRLIRIGGRRDRRFWWVPPAVLVSLLGLPDVAAASTAGTTYNVDASRGSDDATGRSPASAWRGLERAPGGPGPGNHVKGKSTCDG